MLKDFIRNRLKTFKAMLSILFAIVFVLFISITYHLANNRLSYFTASANNKLVMIDKSLSSSIADASQVIHSLAISLSQEHIERNNKHIYDLLNSFDSKLNKYKAIPFSCFKLFDANDLVIAHTLIHFVWPLIIMN